MNILPGNNILKSNGTPLQYPCLENPMDGGSWWAAVHGVAKSWTQLSNFIFTFHFHALEKEMATHSSVLAWRISGTGEPGGLPSMGSHRVGHNWSDLASAAAAANHLILWHPLLLLASIFPSIRVFSNESVLCIRWPKYWSFSYSISPSNEYSGLISFRIDWFDLFAIQGLSRVFSNTTVQKHQFFGTQLSSQSNSHIHTWPLKHHSLD